MNLSEVIDHRLTSLQLQTEQLGSFLKNLSEDEIARRLDRLTLWLSEINAYNHDGVTITPIIGNHLSKPDNFDSLLHELDRLRNETRNGRFQMENQLQRDLEFRRFQCEYRRFFGTEDSFPKLYGLFTDLSELAEPYHEIFLSNQRILEARRAGYEAAVFLDFLQSFRRTTSRPILVVPNNKAQLAGGGYGRQWVIEPIEDHVRNESMILYNGVTSHATMRLNVPSTFTKESVKQLCNTMPHIIIVDGGRIPRNADMMRFSRSSRGYANWFAVFNDLRSQGNTCSYEDDVLLNRQNLNELMKWHEYSIVREQIQEWVTPGDTYKLTLWGPEPTEKAVLGETLVNWPPIDLSGDQPKVVLTNVIIYKSITALSDHRFSIPDEEISCVLSKTDPFSINEIDNELRDRLKKKSQASLTHWGAIWDNPALSEFGFGTHGFEIRLAGPSMEQHVTAMQRVIKSEVDRLMGFL